MHRALAIGLACQRDAGHARRHRGAAITNYTALVTAMGTGKGEAVAVLSALVREAGLDP